MKRKPLSVERRQARAGWIFALPWLIGLVYFFIVPFIQSVWYSFNDVKIATDQQGLAYTFAGLSNYKYMLLKESTFNQSIVSTLTDLLYTVPVVLVFSMFIALLLNQKFKGRMFMRGIFFLPVIIASGVVIKIIRTDVFAQNTLSDATSIFQTGAIEEAMTRIGLPEEIVGIITGVTSGIFDLSWASGIQILLFISALQGIPTSYYEAASIEGANAWECFWKITFPVLSPTSFLVTIYTIIDSFVDVSNPVMQKILERFDSLYYGMASASAVIYFLVIMLVIGLIALIFSKRLFHNG